MGDRRAFDDPVAGKPDNTQQVEGGLRDDAYGSKTDPRNEKPSQQGIGNSSGTEVDNPYAYIQKAVDLFTPGDPGKQNASSAEGQWKKAIEAADKLPIDEYKVKLAEVETQMKSESDPLKSQELLKLKQGLQELVELPVILRMETAVFYLQNAKPDEANSMLEQARKLNPALKDREQFKQLLQISQESSKGTVDKAIGFLKSTGKELVSDGISGGVGLAAFSLIPGGRLFKVGSALLAGGATKHGLALVGLGGDANSPLKNFAWGGVDALAMVSGAAVRQRMMNTFESSITSAGARDIAFRGGVTQAEKLAVFEGRFAADHVGGYREAAVMIEGKSGLDGLKAATGMVRDNVAAKRAAYKAELEKAIKLAPPEMRPALWLEGHMPGLRNVPSNRLAAFQQARSEYLAARGNMWEPKNLNPLNMFRSPTQYDGTLRNLEAITFWNRYKMDAVGIAGSSFIYRGSHEAMKIGDVDPVTGKRHSAYDAIGNTAISTTTDAISGAFVAGVLRWGAADLASTFKLGNGLSERLPVPVRTGLAALPTAGVLFNSELDEAYKSYDRAWEYEKILAEIQKPLEDKPPPTAKDRR